jgi:hypothetical protein
LKRLLGATALLALAGCAGVSSPPPPVTAAIALRAHRSSDELSAARRVFSSRCIECHTLPAINSQSIEAWPHILNTMSVRAGLTAAEHDALLAYIVAAHR